MFAEDFRRAVAAAPRSGLDALASALWQALAAGAIAEAEAEDVSRLIEARRKVAPAPRPPRVRVPRPRPPEAVENRRRLVAGGWIPPALAARFTPGEQAALSVVAREVAAHGACSLTHDEVADLAGIGRTTARNALRQARLLGLVAVEERRLSPTRSAPNIVRVVDPSWSGWLRLARRRALSGVKTRTPSYNQYLRSGRPEARTGRQGLPDGAGEGRRPRPGSLAPATDPGRARGIR